MVCDSTSKDGFYSTYLTVVLYFDKSINLCELQDYALREEKTHMTRKTFRGCKNKQKATFDKI